MNLSIGQVAEQFNLSIHTLRYYEKEGLLPFVKRTSSGIRQFDDYALEGLRVIECLKKTGMPLKEIKDFIQSCEVGDETLQKRRDMFYERQDVVLKEMAELNKVMELIKFKCWYYDTALALGSEEAVINMDKTLIPDEIRALH